MSEDLRTLIQELQKNIEELKKENKALKEAIELEKSKTPIALSTEIQKKLKEAEELSDELERKVNIAVEAILKYAKAINF